MTKLTRHLVHWALIAASPAAALPDPRNAAAIPAVLRERSGAEPGLHGATAIADHDGRVIYVSPASRRRVTAKVEWNTVPNCDELRNWHDSTYRVPPAGRETKAALEGGYSPFFDLHFGNSVRLTALLRRLMDLLGEGERASALHRAMHEVVRDADVHYRQAQHAVAIAEERLRALRADRAAGRLEEPTAAEEEAIAELRLGDARAREQERFRVWVEARRRLREVPGFLTVEEHERRREIIVSDIRVATRIAQLRFEAAETLLNRLETLPVGLARARVSIWGDEVARARAAAPGSRIEPLPLSEAVLDASHIRAQFRSGDGSGTRLMEAASERLGTGAAQWPVSLTSVDGVEMTIPVSQAAHCMGSSDREARRRRYAVALPDGTATEYAGYEWASRTHASPPVQMAALRYRYRTHGEPLSIRCELDANRFMSFHTRWGEDGFLFWSERWEKTHWKRLEESGVFCRVVNRPVLSDAVAQQRWVDDITQAMMQELMAEYLLRYRSGLVVNLSNLLALPRPEATSWRDRAAGAYEALCRGASSCRATGSSRRRESGGAGAGENSRHEHALQADKLIRDFSADASLVHEGATLLEIGLE